MILSQLIKNKTENNYQSLKVSSFNELLTNKLYLLKKKKYLLKNLFQFFNKYFKRNNINKNSLLINKILYKNRTKNNQFYDNSLVSLIFNIKIVKNNIFINIADIKGHTKFVYSAASAYKKKPLFNIRQKKQLNNLLIDLLKVVINNTKSIQKNTAVLHFKNTNISQELLLINLIKNVFFIKSIKSFNSNPHNGCRPKKLKRTKSKRPLIM